jgi:hypothetical protein
MYHGRESSITDLHTFGQCPAPQAEWKFDDWDQIIEYTEQAAESDIDTLIVETTGIQETLWDHVCDEEFNSDWSTKGFLNFYQGPSVAARNIEYWPKLIGLWNDIFQGIKGGKRKSVILISHSQVEVFQNPLGSDYSKISCCIDKRMMEPLERSVRAIIYYGTEIITGKKNEQEKTKSRNPTEAERMLYTNVADSFVAKNIYGLPQQIEAGTTAKETYEALTSNLQKSINK